jgi:tetratricopeptide (TPR) repeat protein
MELRATSRRIVLSVLALVVVITLSYAPAFRAGFIWDDDDHLTHNPAVAASGGLRLIWSSLTISRYYPLTLTTFWVERHLWGLVPLPYHAVNIALHAVNAVLLWFLLRKLNVRGAWLAAALWGVHPVNVESVAWVTELKNTQSGFFFLLCLLCYLRYEERYESWWWFAAANVLFAAALLSKPSTVFLPIALLLYVWWQRGRWQRDDLFRLSPFAGMAYLMSMLTIIEQQHLVQKEGPADWSLRLADRFVVAGRALWFYAGKLLWPRNLAFVYPRWQIDANTVTAWLPWLAVIVVAVACWTLRRHPWAKTFAFGAGWYALALSPVLGFANVYYFRYSFVADHFAYLAGMGFIALVVAGFASVVKQRPIQLLASVIALGILGGQTWVHCEVFHDNETLWLDTLQKNPASALAHNNLGNLYQHHGQLPLALDHLQEAAQLAPGYAETHNNLGVVFAQFGRTDEAIAQFTEAIRLRPSYSDARTNLLHALTEQAQRNETPSK